MTVNELDEEYLKYYTSKEFLDLERLQSLRVFAICVHILYCEGGDWNEDDIWTPFPWLLRVLKTVQKSNSIEEIIIKIVHENSDKFRYLPPGFHDHFSWQKFELLFTERFPCLCNVKLLLQAHHMPVLCEIIDVGHPLAVDLLQRGVLEIKELDIAGEYHFCPRLRLPMSTSS